MPLVQEALLLQHHLDDPKAALEPGGRLGARAPRAGARGLDPGTAGARDPRARRSKLAVKASCSAWHAQRHRTGRGRDRARSVGAPGHRTRRPAGAAGRVRAAPGPVPHVSPTNRARPTSRCSTWGSPRWSSTRSLCADLGRGRRPSFDTAERPERARALVEHFARALERQGCRVAQGRFGAHMLVELANDGPLTFVFER